MSSCNVNLHDAASQALLLQQEPLEHQLGELAPAKLKAYDRKAMSDWQLATEALGNAHQKAHFDDQILDACHLKVRGTVSPRMPPPFFLHGLPFSSCSD